MKIEMITSYRDLPIGKYLDICKVCKEEGEEIDRQVAIITILTGLPEDEVLGLPLAEYAELSGRIGFLEKPTDDKGRIAASYKIGEWELIPTTEIQKITTAQYIDFQEFIKKSDERIVEIVSCILVPKGCKYNDGYDIVEVQKAVREHLSTHDAFSLFTFFLIRFRESIAASLSSSESEMMKLKEGNPVREQMMRKIQALRTLLGQNGVG